MPPGIACRSQHSAFSYQSSDYSSFRAPNAGFLRGFPRGRDVRKSSVPTARAPDVELEFLLFRGAELFTKNRVRGASGFTSSFARPVRPFKLARFGYLGDASEAGFPVIREIVILSESAYSTKTPGLFPYVFNFSGRGHSYVSSFNLSLFSIMAFSRYTA